MNYPELIDTHCHINTMIKPTFDIPLSLNDIPKAREILKAAALMGVTRIINVGTSLIESQNCVMLASHFDNVWASVGIHPNDCTAQWLDDFKEIKKLVHNYEQHRIVALGECGLDRHYPDFNLPRQIDAFKAHIELALEYNLPLIVHTRDARDETLKVLEEYKDQLDRGIIHCFSEDLSFAQQVTAWGFHIGIGGTITYPKNDELRRVATTIPLINIVLETDAPFLPMQSMRGKPNHPQYIYEIAQYLSTLREVSLEEVATTTTNNSLKLFAID